MKTPRKTIGKYIVNVYILYKGIHLHFCEDGKLRKDVTRVHKSSHCHALVSHTLTAITVKLIFVLFHHTLLVLNSIMAAIEERKCRPRCPGCVSRKTQDQEDNEHNGYSEQCVAADITALNMLNYGFQKANTPSVSLNDLE